ncbi:hypothetical protein ACF0H5_005822 [Mactra antiquata]
MAGAKEDGLISFSSMRQPPLIKQLKGILSEYPDGGQILKELIQNAEDADATVIEVEYDTRKINNETSNGTPIYTKFFKGPALCVYNDAVFTKKDWEGIRMIYSSVKEDDRLKVGRFGLGFKSVFHITDFPCVLSGDQCLMIDPQQPQEKVNAMFKLSKIDQLNDTGLPAEVFWSALNNKFGLTQDCVKKGYFKGTIFWFPLRERASKLSETLYDTQKVFDLFDDFKTDSSSILVFLKNLEKIQLFVSGEKPSRELIASVEILDDNGQVKKLRRKFKEDLKKITKDYKGDDFSYQIQMTIRTGMDQTFTDTLWSVVNYFVGNSASTEFRKLINDDSLEYSPYVGVACPISQSEVDEYEGHVFCFLPLPKEGSKLTGLPVHVNGFFALSQSRHHIKLETDGQSGKKIDDKSILWNRCLIKEAIPKAYCKLILNMIDYSIHLGNTIDAVRNVYYCWPRKGKTVDRWRVLEYEVYSKLKTEKIFYATYKKSWIALTETCFATFSSLSEKFMHVTESVKRCMNQIGMNYAEVPMDILETMKHHYKKVKDIKPDLLAKNMHRCDAYKNMDSNAKTQVLLYLLLDKNCFDKLKGLSLLPLASGQWTTFDHKHETVYVCEEEVLDILPGLEYRLLMKKSNTGLVVYEKISSLCGKGYYQLKQLGEMDLVKLIETCLDIHFRESGKYIITQSTKLTTQWLQSLWSYIIGHQNISAFQNVQIVPKLILGNWESPQLVKLVKFTDIVLVKTVPKATICSGIARCFETMGVTIIDALPTWIHTDNVKQFLYLPTFKGILSLLEHILLKTSWQNTIEVFNQTCNEADRKAMVTFLIKCTHLMTEDVIKMLNKLKLFEAKTQIGEKGRFVTVAETKEYVLDTVKFPVDVTLPFPCCLSNCKTEILMSKMGGRIVELHELILEKLQSFHMEVNSEEIPKFMQYIITNFNLIEMNDDIIEHASKIPFLRVGKKRYMPKELFDPLDANLVKLLYNEDLLPETKKQLNKETVRTLKVLGLRTSEHIDADIVFQVAESLDKWSKHYQSGDEYIEKADALVKFLKQRPFILHETCLWDQKLSDRIESLECIPIDQAYAQYPSCLPRYEHKHKLCKPRDLKEAKLSLLVGASMAIISCDSNDLISAFGWHCQPDLKTIWFQLQTIIECYSVQIRPDLMQSINMIYSHLSLRIEEIRRNSDMIGNEKLVWTGDGFQSANKVVINKRHSDLDLSPYFYFLPEEFVRYDELFETLGCRNLQDHEVLIDALYQIKENHAQTSHENHVTRKDQHLVCSILDQIASFIDDEKHINIEDVPVMVHDNNKMKLAMFPLSECVFDDDPDYFYEDIGDMHLVHEMISQDTVNSLGIKSITRKVLLDAEDLGIELWEQKEHLTTRINTLLRDGYTDGLSVPKELIQNADDAGAKTVKFLYDERQNYDSRKRVLSRGMASFQGPALWIFNDAQFSKEDLKNITKFNGATKMNDCKTIGKFGLGFCSVYNLTDIPSFMTGKHLVFFDPHETHLPISRRGGLKYTLPNRTLVARHADQFKPYNGVFDCDVMNNEFETYHGSLFRLPLRTEQQARESKISNRTYTNEEMKDLLHMFIQNAGNMLLFSQNVCSVEFHHLSEKSSSPNDSKLLCKVDKESYILDKGRLNYLRTPVLHRVSEILSNGDQFIETHKSTIRQEIPVIDSELVSGLDLNNLTTKSETTWLTSWAIGSGKSLDLYKTISSDGAVPLASVSIPCEQGVSTKPLKLINVPTGFYTGGHVFCFLPMPIKTKLQMHINGCFSISSDRRRLLTKSEDDKLAQTHTWNECLLKDALVTAHINLLEVITKGDVGDSFNSYHDLWPVSCETFLDVFVSAFYRRIVSDNAVVFKSVKTWNSFQDICFLDFSIRKSHLGDIALNFLSTFCPRHAELLVDISEAVFINIRDWNKDKIALIDSKTIKKEELLLLFLKHIHDSFWNDLKDDRNALIIEALRSSEENIMRTIKTVECVPTEPNQSLRKPSDLIHPNAIVTKLFMTEDEVFPSRSAAFRSQEILQKLLVFGMCDDSLPFHLLINRCKTVESLSEECCRCALNRSGNILRYLSGYTISKEIKKQVGAQEILSDICMLPIMEKPKQWIFSWKSESVENRNLYHSNSKLCKNHSNVAGVSMSFTKPKYLFRQNVQDLVGTCQLILNEHLFDRNFDEQFRFLSVRDIQHVTSDMIACQILAVSKEYTRETQVEVFFKLHYMLLTTLDELINKTEDTNHALNSLKMLSEQPIVLIGKDLVKPQKVAECLKQECRPFLYKLPDLYKGKNIFYALGVKKHFDVQDIIEVMDEVKANDEHDIPLLNNLLINLEDILKVSNTAYDDIQVYHDRIIAHDTEGNVWPTYELVTDNENFQTDLPMKTLHPSIAPALGETLGVKAKQRRCYEKIKTGISFGQREKLVTRIQGLLKSYPCDSSVMKELLQNADDSGATEIHFIKDYRSLSCKTLFSETCEPLQGPSLCVFNNSYFTESDIEGIHDLGKGSKSDDPSRTGQYGVGFNAVYHLTDTPSFVTVGPGVAKDGLLFIFDPLCKYVPLATLLEPGMMSPVQEVKQNFPEHLLGFSLEKLLVDKVGTVFRFPLRNKESTISANTVSIEQMNSIIESFREDMFECLLFLKNIQRITVSSISADTINEEFSVEIKIPDQYLQKKIHFNDCIRKESLKHVDKAEDLLCIDPIEIIYPVDVFDCNMLTQSWVIVQRFGIGNIENEGSHFRSVKKSFKDGDLKYSPTGGVAIPISFHRIGAIACTEQFQFEPEFVKKIKRKWYGRAFSFLPLPVKTGLPVHVNGHFALDHESRRELWADGFRMKWNMCIIENIVVPAWKSGMEFIKTMINPVVETSKTWRDVNQEMDAYHKLFPLIDETTGQFWKYVACTFYSHVYINEVKIFPSILKQQQIDVSINETAKKFNVSWEYIGDQTKNSFNGVLNCITNSLEGAGKYPTSRACLQLETLLKRFGLKLLQAPLDIRQSIEKSGITSCMSSSPDLVIKFLRTYSDYFGKACDIGQINSNIANTRYETPANLKLLLQFISLDAQFCDKITGLPVILTADGYVRECCEERPVFISKHANLLPGSLDLFVHDSILEVFIPNDLGHFETGSFRCFTFDNFLELLPQTLSADRFASKKDIPLPKKDVSDDVFTMIWLQNLFDFLCQDSISADGSSTNVDPDMLLQKLKSLDKWSFLPITRPTGECALTPFCNKSYIIDVSLTLSANYMVEKVLKKLDIPRLNVEVLRNCKESLSLSTHLPKFVASVKQPYRLLKCLVHHKDILISQISKCSEGNELLEFFARSIIELKKEYSSDEDLAEDLRQLPLYSTLQGNLTDLKKEKQTFVLPRVIPKDGIEEWADSCKVILLQESYSNNEIHNFLDLQKADADTFYGENILPNIHALPQRHFLAHAKFLKERIKTKKPIHKKIIQYLSKIAFIEVGGVMRRADDLYDPSNIVFKLMCGALHFPPEHFLDPDWKPFLEELGLISDVNDEMLIRFAREIERQNTTSHSNICTKSEKLLSHFINKSRKWKDTTINEMKTIRFVVPFKVSNKYNSVYPQLNNAKTLICFKGSVSSHHSLLCWSSSNIMSGETFDKIGSSMKTKLEILDRPSLESVILHCQNVCPSLKTNIRELNRQYIEQQMTTFYEFFRKHTDSDLSVIKTLDFVHLQEENELVSVADIVIGISDDNEIKPYIYKAPVYYGKYHQLFEALGSKKHLRFCHYAGVIRSIHCETENRELNPTERSFVRRAVRGLLQIDVNKDETVQEIQHLYLPDENMVLKNSTLLIVSNNYKIERRLRGKVDIDIMAGQSFLQMSSLSFDIMNTWPIHLKPKFLTDIVEEQTCSAEECSADQTDSNEVRIIERFLLSKHLLLAICRLLNDQLTSSREPFDRKYYEGEISKRLKAVKVVHLPSLRTKLRYNGNLIDGTESDIPFNIEYGELNIARKFYFVNLHDAMGHLKRDILPGLTQLVQSCALMKLNASSTMCMQLIFFDIGSPQKAQDILDSHHIKSYDSSNDNEYFPAPGTYVERQFIPFLEQGILPFEEYEYDHVAMELEDIPFDQECIDTLFIYVKIIAEVPERKNLHTNVIGNLRKMYWVETGNKDVYREKIPIYRLYRFVRRQPEPGALQPIDADTQDAEPFDRHCVRLKNELIQAWGLPESERKRIFKRMLLKWHPDKNLEILEYSQKMFQYLKIIYSRLENGEIIDADTQDAEPFDRHCVRLKNELIQAWGLPESERKRIFKRMLLKWHPDKNLEILEYSQKMFQYLKIIYSRLENGEIMVETVEEEMFRGPSRSSQTTEDFLADINRRATKQARAYKDNVEEYSKSTKTGIFSHLLSTSRQTKQGDVIEAKRWMKQAKRDFNAALAFLSSAVDVQAYNWICKICHQACETALKAACLYNDRSAVIGRFTSLRLLAPNSEIAQQAGVFDDRFGDPARLTTPDTASRPDIPSTIFDKEDAEYALTTTKEILEIVDDFIDD